MFPAIFEGLLEGINTGWLVPILEKYYASPENKFTFTSDERAWISLLHLISVLCGLILCLLIVDKFGRKKILLFSWLCYITGWILIRYTKSVPVVNLSRIILGIEGGLSSPTVIMLIGENSSSNERGAYCALNTMFYFGGIVAEYLLVTYCSYDTVAAMNLAIGFLLFPSIFLMKESAQFLMLKGRYEEAKKNFQWLFTDDEKEFEKLRQCIEDSTTSSLSPMQFFDTPAFYKSVALATSLIVLIYSTGFLTLLTYTYNPFSLCGMTMRYHEYTICYGSTMTAFSFGSSFFIDRFSRRTVLLNALEAGAVTNLATAGLYYVYQYITPIPHFPWLIFSTITLFLAIASFGLLPVAAALQSELFSQKIKPLGVTLTNVGAFLTSTFLTSLAFIKIDQHFEVLFSFLYLAAMCLVAFAFAYLYLPETGGKSLLEIQQMFEDFNVRQQPTDTNQGKAQPRERMEDSAWIVYM